MYPGPPPRVDRRLSRQSVAAGFVLDAAILALLVAVSHPVATGAVLAAAIGPYAVVELLRRSAVERTLRFCRAGICLRVQLGTA